MTAINANSFQPTETTTESFGIVERGTVEITLQGKTQRVSGRRVTTTYRADDNNTSITAYGLVGRYNSGTKMWPAHVELYTAGKLAGMERGDFGRDDRDPKFRKMNAIFFAKGA